jgi:hypothetical protein
MDQLRTGLGIVTTQMQNFVFPAQGRILFGQGGIHVLLRILKKKLSALEFSTDVFVIKIFLYFLSLLFKDAVSTETIQCVKCSVVF